MNLQDIGTILGEELIFGEGSNDRITCSFPHVETKSEHADGCLRSTYGDGDTNEEAMADYADELDGRWLVYRATAHTLLGGTSVKKEFQLPEEIYATADEPRSVVEAEAEAEESGEFLETVGFVTCALLVIAGGMGVIFGGITVVDNTNITRTDSGYQVTMFPEEEVELPRSSADSLRMLFPLPTLHLITTNGMSYSVETLRSFSLLHGQDMRVAAANLKTLNETEPLAEFLRKCNDIGVRITRITDGESKIVYADPNGEISDSLAVVADRDAAKEKAEQAAIGLFAAIADRDAIEAKAAIAEAMEAKALSDWRPHVELPFSWTDRVLVRSNPVPYKPCQSRSCSCRSGKHEYGKGKGKASPNLRRGRKHSKVGANGSKYGSKIAHMRKLEQQLP